MYISSLKQNRRNFKNPGLKEDTLRVQVAEPLSTFNINW
jgi:hypothetical protein